MCATASGYFKKAVCGAKSILHMFDWLIVKVCKAIYKRGKVAEKIFLNKCLLHHVVLKCSLHVQDGCRSRNQHEINTKTIQSFMTLDRADIPLRCLGQQPLFTNSRLSTYMYIGK